MADVFFSADSARRLDPHPPMTVSPRRLRRVLSVRSRMPVLAQV